MANDFLQITNNILLFAPSINIAQAQQITQMSFARFAERRIWSWLVGSSCFVPVDLYQTGTATFTQGSATVTGSGTTWTSAMIGRQIRNGLYTPIYTIKAVNSATELVMDQDYAPTTSTGASYMIYLAYFVTPVDFREFLSLKDPSNGNYRLNMNLTQPVLDAADAQRSNFNYAIGGAFLDYVGISQGQVGTIQQIVGGGAAPVSSSPTGFTYPATATYVVTITTGGSPGDASMAFSWFRISNGITGSLNGPLVVDDSDYISMSDGVGVYFPSGVYVTGNIFTFSAAPSSSQQQARFEMWPHVANSNFNYPYSYYRRIPPFDEDNQQLPPMVRQDCILEIALGIASLMPGTADNPNSIYGMQNFEAHNSIAEKLIYELELKDDSTATRDLIFSSQTPFCPNPYFDGNYMQNHGFPFAGMYN